MLFRSTLIPSLQLAGAPANLAPVDYVWEPETNVYTMATDLLRGLNMYPPYWNATLNTYASRVRPRALDEMPAQRYSRLTEPRLLLAQSDEGLLVNIAVDPRAVTLRQRIISAHPQRTVPIAVITGLVSDAFPINDATLRRYQTISRQDDFIPDQTIAEAVSEFELRQQNTLINRTTIETVLDPYRRPHEFYLLTLENEAETVWMCQGWKMDLVPIPKMTHSISRVTGSFEGFTDASVYGVVILYSGSA